MLKSTKQNQSLFKMVSNCATLWLFVGISLASSIAIAQVNVEVSCNGSVVGYASYSLDRGGVFGYFMPFFDSDNNGRFELSEAAAQCEADHFNWFQLVQSTTTPAIDIWGRQLTSFIDPPQGGLPPQLADFFLVTI